MRECRQCGKQFETKVHNKVFCSPTCKTQSYYQSYSCVVCGVDFKSKHPSRKYCSNKCQWNLQRKPWVDLTCTHCNKEFLRPKGQVRFVKHGYFCSDSCRLKHQTLSIGENSPRWNSVIVECEYCKRNFSKQANQVAVREKHFCTHLCYSHWLSDNTKGEKNPSFRGGRKLDRGEDWEEIAEYTRWRDHYTCQRCGQKQEDQALDVHHKIPYRFFDSPEKANQDENLVTLCRSCHGKEKSHWWQEVPEEYRQYM